MRRISPSCRPASETTCEVATVDRYDVVADGVRIHEIRLVRGEAIARGPQRDPAIAHDFVLGILDIVQSSQTAIERRMQEAQQTMRGDRPIDLHVGRSPVERASMKLHDHHQTEQADHLIEAVVLVVAVEHRDDQRPIAETGQRKAACSPICTRIASP